MFLSYLKLSVRLLIRNPFLTFINVLGLSIGIAVFVSLWQYASTQLGSDQQHKDFDRIVRICLNWRWTERGRDYVNIVGCSAPDKTFRIAHDFPEVESFLRIVNQAQFIEAMVGHESQVALTNEERDIKVKEVNAAYADPNLFEFFTIPLIYGDAHHALKNGNSIVLSQKTAHKYFGDQNPMGKVLVLNGSRSLVVTGVFKDLPTNTHLNFDLVISNASFKEKWDTFIWFAGTHYLKLKSGTNVEDVDARIRKLSPQYWAVNFNNVARNDCEMWLQPLKDVVFSKDYYMDFFVPKTKSVLILLRIFAIVVLAMACINYVNITLNRTSKRLKELGVRKTVGASVKDIMWQFVVESVVVYLVSFAAACTLLQVASRPIELFLHAKIDYWSGVSVIAPVIFAVVIVVSTLIIAISPALTFRNAIHGTLSKESYRASWLPGILTTCQYAAAVAMISYVFIIAHQMNFVLGKTIGHGDERIAIIDSPVVRGESFNSQLDAFTALLTSEGLVKETAISNTIPGDRLTTTNMIFVGQTPDGAVGLDSNGGVDENFIPFFKIPLIAGRNFRANDGGEVVILSREATKRLNYDKPEDAIGDQMFVDFSSEWKFYTATVIGVIEDYQMTPLVGFRRETGNGIILSHKDHLLTKLTPEKIAVKINYDVPNGRQAIERLFSESFPGNPFNLYFLDDYFNHHYDNDMNSRDQVIFFALISIGIACIGLFGMISSKVVEKTKEIGVRKVLGADTMHIFRILLSGTIRQTIIAAFVGAPVGWYLTREYLQRFAERIEFQWWHFALPVGILIIIMLSTVTTTVLRAAMNSPVNALKCE